MMGEAVRPSGDFFEQNADPREFENLPVVSPGALNVALERN
jgi:hypothetical protein